jgi:hypothetical protein
VTAGISWMTMRPSKREKKKKRQHSFNIQVHKTCPLNLGKRIILLLNMCTAIHLDMPGAKPSPASAAKMGEGAKVTPEAQLKDLAEYFYSEDQIILAVVLISVRQCNFDPEMSILMLRN